MDAPTPTLTDTVARLVGCLADSLVGVAPRSFTCQIGS